MSKISIKQSDTLDASVSYSIDIVDLSKEFRRQTRKGGYTTLKTAMLDIFRRSETEHEVTSAVKDLTIRVPRGASVGIIGKNGSGKSTLLKLITGIYQPTDGKISVNGRVAALIELGAGFHPDFSGRENLVLGGVMHGLSRKEIEERIPEIVAFAELERVIDDPVRTYSSGMFMRLGFSLAVHTDPDILMIDEVLAVGDAGFVSKCRERISKLRKEGKTLLLVSHDLDAVERWSDEVVWLHEGEVRDRGRPRRVIDHYREFVEKGEEAELETREQEAASSTENATDEAAPERWGSREIEITEVRLLAENGEEKLLFHGGQKVVVEIDYTINQPIEDVVFGIGIDRSDGLVVHGSNTDIESVEFADLGSSGTVAYELESLELLEGNYLLHIAAHREDGYPYDYHQGVKKFAVRSRKNQVGVFEPSHSWKLKTNSKNLQRVGRG